VTVLDAETAVTSDRSAVDDQCIIGHEILAIR
jgi:hypothetical protein